LKRKKSDIKLRKSSAVISPAIVIYKTSYKPSELEEITGQWRREQGEVPRRKEEAKSPLVQVCVREREAYFF
jgi:hypothetical protein